MRLKSLNKLDPKYGFCDALGYDMPDYHGHQKGIALCIKDKATGKIYRNYMRPLDGNANADELVEEILNNKNIKLLVDEEKYFDPATGGLGTRELYLLPYANLDSTAFKTSVNYDGADKDPKNIHKMTIEVLFVINGLNRYIEITTERNDAGPVQAALDYLKDPDNLTDIGFEWIEGTENNQEGWYIDVYNEANKEGMAFMGTTPEDFLTYINSIRLTGIETFGTEPPKEEEKDENEPEEVTIYAD